jgi:hypothetical protein
MLAHGTVGIGRQYRAAARNPVRALGLCIGMRMSMQHRSILAFAMSACLTAVLAGCVGAGGREPPIDPDLARAQIARVMPEKTTNRDGWAVDIFTAFEALHIPPTVSNACAVIAVAEQESSLQVDPQVPGLPAIARREIEAKAASHHIPMLLVEAALALDSPTGVSYRRRLDSARTEKELSNLFQDFIGMVPLGERLFGDLNPVRTGGPMQVSIAFAEQQARRERYPYPVATNIRNEVFTRRGGVYFGTAHLLDYPAPYDDMLYRFADFNAGHYASRNAGFQNAAAIASKTRLALDGDLLRYGSAEPSKTELAVRKIGQRLELTDEQIRSDLERGEGDGFERTKLYARVFELADSAGRGRPVPRAIVPRIKLESPKITRQLTTEWFARRVNDRYLRCLARGGNAS